MPPPTDKDLAVQTRQNKAKVGELKKQSHALRLVVAAGRVVQFNDLVKFERNNG